MEGTYWPVVPESGAAGEDEEGRGWGWEEGGGEQGQEGEARTWRLGKFLNIKGAGLRKAREVGLRNGGDYSLELAHARDGALE